MSAAYGRCDLCGRFAGSKGIESYDDWQPDYWNGPRTTFRCPECEARREPAAGPSIAEMRSDEDRATVRAIRDRAASRDNPLPKGDDMTTYIPPAEAVEAAARAYFISTGGSPSDREVLAAQWDQALDDAPFKVRNYRHHALAALTAAGPIIAAEVERLREDYQAACEARMTFHDELDEAQRQVADLRAGIEALLPGETVNVYAGGGNLVSQRRVVDPDHLRTLLAGSGEQPGEVERAWLNADPRKAAENLRAVVGAGEQPGEDECEECEAVARMIYSDPSDLTGPCSRHSHDCPAPAVPDSTDVRERVWQALRESRRTGLGGMTETQALDHMTDAVLAAVGRPPMTADDTVTVYDEEES